MFLDVRLPEEIERGSSGGATFNTTVLTLSSGAEQRNINWSAPLARWDISYGIANKSQHDKFLNLFYLAQGRALGFRFRDWTDYQIGINTDTNLEEPQIIGIGDDVKERFQIYKEYRIGSLVYNRAITRPTSPTVKVFFNSVEQNPTIYSVNYNTGVITFDDPPLLGINIAIVAEFDIPVRFDKDELQLNATLVNQFSVEDIPIVELKETLEIL